ncbi:hypothetical protein SPBR_07954 [Sporothrix brasiliensis 5110]|uniref:Uncharacterized protein n=1 Tax=Sporothrix brasiliensis 5110 TaxID=1398154 RepID=A0A0C2IQ29_9PEZI|nr:uncharacterized protein SPBR_07954 [Sporothrix brasiliensis 5110]KIH89040.1 hypothetical protein SPBR_07954 [Sporothrix brasiliensis 5110]
MAPSHPTSIVAISLLAMTVYTAILAHEADYGILMALISIVGNVGAILLYLAKSSMLAPSIIVSDMFAGAFCSVGTLIPLLRSFHGSRDSRRPPNDSTKSDAFATMTMYLALTVV